MTGDSTIHEQQKVGVSHLTSAAHLIKGGMESGRKDLDHRSHIDVVDQYIVFHWFYPGEAILVAAILALVPYLLIRGPVNRMARRRRY